ncbi:Putative major facilitator superfamily, MFS transporter superfamily [Septoria linicola]|uniref:Major facilitator superfamily, MFS transporter superfamily n=1 Tax=Septoria linicola TaxID=215465 RepID=A0A9Q9AXD7_9PEZI|nr:putative major facilitator superfamily, MFS transporter superfamily [Septoria linicola]USW56885.1 Putative major facilitator superfamily, MFS transporter superfamily [Septoria linicola]
MEPTLTDAMLDQKSQRPRSHPPLRYGQQLHYLESPKIPTLPSQPHDSGSDPWQLPSLQQTSISRSSSRRSAVMPLKPKPSFTRLQSLDSLITYREEKAEWKRASSFIQAVLTDEEQQASASYYDGYYSHPPTREPTIRSEPDTVAGADLTFNEKSPTPSTPAGAFSINDPAPDQDTEQPKNKFRTFAAEIGFCFTIAMTQFLAEYMISGFAIELPKIMNKYTSPSDLTDAGSMGMFWPASLLSLILSATLLIFARISDMHGGYLPFMFGVIWLGLWSLLAGFAKATVLLDISRAMQGLAIAAYIPSTFAMIGSIYPEGPRKNLVLGLYSGCAPLGFFAGFLAAGALPDDAPGWYFWIAAVLSFVTAVTAYLTVPHDRTDRQQLGLKMDWIGAFLITGGLILVAYALAVEPYANQFDTGRSGWTFPMVLGPLISGLACLATAFWVEGWYAACPLLPFDFFSPKSVKAFSLACLCFYASYGVWLYESAQFFSSPSATGTIDGIQGLTLAAWYTPTAIGGLILCVVGGALLHIIPIMVLLIVSGLAWMGAPLLLAMAPLPMHYWSFVMPSMLCATIGIDLTFTISVVYLSSVSPLRYQGLAGAVSSILVNLAMSFSLSISEIVAVKAESAIIIPDTASPADQILLADLQANRGYKYAFIYAAASAGAGLLIAVLFVRISRAVVQERKTIDLEDGGTRPSSEVSTLVNVARA